MAHIHSLTSISSPSVIDIGSSLIPLSAFLRFDIINTIASTMAMTTAPIISGTSTPMVTPTIRPVEEPEVVSTDGLTVKPIVEEAEVVSTDGLGMTVQMNQLE